MISDNSFRETGLLVTPEIKEVETKLALNSKAKQFTKDLLASTSKLTTKVNRRAKSSTKKKSKKNRGFDSFVTAAVKKICSVVDMFTRPM